MKKTRAFVIAVAVTLGLSGKVHAALYPQSIYVGNKGYHIDYLTSHVKELNDLLTSGTISDIYYCDESGNVSSIFTGISIDESTFSSNVGLNYSNNSNVIYIDEMGVRHVLSFNGTSYAESGSYGYAQVQVTPMGLTGLKIANIKLNDVSSIFSTAKYFKVEDSGTIKKILPIDTSNISNSDYQITLITSSNTEKLSILSADYNVIAYGDLDISTTSAPLASISFTATDYKEADYVNNGNLYSNINNGGLVAKNNNVDSYSSDADKINDRWVYYSNSADSGKLYKKNTAGIQDYKIAEDTAKYINVVGDWIYYSNYSDGEKIYKVKTDGTNRRKVCDDRASYINVGAGYIYYANQNDGGKIYKVSVDSVNLTSSSTTKVSNDEAQYINLKGDIIYYSNRSDKNKLYSIHADGSYRSKICDDNANYITVTDSDIFYSTDQNKLYRIDKKGQGTPQWINIKVDITDKKGVTTTSSDKISSFNIIGNNIYYVSNLDNKKLYLAAGLSNYTIKATKYADEAGVGCVNVINDNGDDLVYYAKGTKLYVATDKPLESVDSKGKKTVTYYTQAIAKTKLDLKIVSYDKIVTSTVPILGTVSNIEDYMPDRVAAVMNDGSQQQLIVDWDMKSGSSSKTSGSLTYKGVIVGYGGAVTFQSINQSKAPSADNISVINHANAQDDYVIVKGLIAGDVVTVYRDADKTERLATGTADASGVATVTLTGDNVLPNDSSVVYVTVTTPGIAESDVTEANGTATNETSNPLDSSNNIVITNYAQGGNDTIHIDSGTGDAKLQKDDLIKVYTVKNGSRVLLQAQTVKADNTPIEELKKYTCDFVLSSTSSLDEAGGTVYITRTSVTGKESVDLVLSYSAGLAPEVDEYSITSIKDITGRNVSLTLKDLPQTDTNYAYYYKVISSKPTDLLKYKDKLTTTAGTDITSGWTLYTKGDIISALNSDYVYVAKTYNYSGDVRVLNASYRQAINAVDDTVTGALSVSPQDTVVGGTETINYTLGEDFAGGEVKIVVPYTISNVISSAITSGGIGSVTVSNGVIDITGINGVMGDIISIDIDQSSSAGFYTFVVNSEWNGDAAIKASKYHPASQAVVVREAAPSAALSKGTGSGTTKITGLAASTTYEYVVNNSSTALTQSSTEWTASGKTAVSSAAGEIDNVSASVNQYIHVRVKSTSTTPASQIQDIGTPVSETITLGTPTSNKVAITLDGTRNVVFDNTYIYHSSVIGDIAAAPTISGLNNNANTATVGGNGTVTAAISANVITISASGTLLTSAIDSSNNCVYFTVKDGTTNADKLVKVVIANKNIGDTLATGDLTVSIVDPTP